MAVLDPLATETDLSDRGITIPDGADVDALLASASASIRDAAGVAISRAESVITLMGDVDAWLPLPVSPVRAVTAVSVDGTTVADWKLREGRLWRSCGWQPTCEPSEVTMTVDHGYDDVPADIIDLCCSLVASAAASTEDGYASQRGLVSVAIDDYREGYAKGDEEVINPMELPKRTRDWLCERFGTTVHVVGTY